MNRNAANNAPRPHRVRNDAGRRIWSPREEEVLVAGLKELTADRWKSENGFRGGYLQQLERIMRKSFPDTDLKANPHINSRITTWKRYYSSLYTMLSKTGIGLDAKHMIEATSEVWEAHVKSDPNSRLMKHKSWPLYEDWCEIFGKDRATGASVEDIACASADTNVWIPKANKDQNLVDDQGTDEGAAENEEVSESQPEASVGDKSTSCSKRKSFTKSDPMCEIVSNFCQSASSRLGEIAMRIGYEQDLSKARREIYGFVDKIEGLTMCEKLRATHLLAQNTEDVDIFMGLPDEAKEEWTKMKLDGLV